LSKFLILAIFYGLKTMFQLKTDALAPMGAASFCGGVHHKRYSGQQEIAPSFNYAQDGNLNQIKDTT
jgi:hypothetical protein